jgi:hypothetical protein
MTDERGTPHSHQSTRIAFGLHDGHLDALLTGRVDVGIGRIYTRQETTVVPAADGYA